MSISPCCALRRAGGRAMKSLPSTPRRSASFAPDDTSYLAQMLRAYTIPHRSWLAYNERRHQMRLAWDAFFEDWDVLLCPAAASAAFPHDQVGERHERTILGQWQAGADHRSIVLGWLFGLLLSARDGGADRALLRRACRPGCRLLRRNMRISPHCASPSCSSATMRASSRRQITPDPTGSNASIDSPLNRFGGGDRLSLQLVDDQKFICGTMRFRATDGPQNLREEVTQCLTKNTSGFPS